MVLRDRPKRVTLPNGRTFMARYKRVTRRNLPANIHLERPYKQRAAPKGKREIIKSLSNSDYPLYINCQVYSNGSRTP